MSACPPQSLSCTENGEQFIAWRIDIYLFLILIRFEFPHFLSLRFTSFIFVCIQMCNVWSSKSRRRRSMVLPHCLEPHTHKCRKHQKITNSNFRERMLNVYWETKRTRSANICSWIRFECNIFAREQHTTQIRFYFKHVALSHSLALHIYIFTH